MPIACASVRETFVGAPATWASVPSEGCFMDAKTCKDFRRNHSKNLSPALSPSSRDVASSPARRRWRTHASSCIADRRCVAAVLSKYSVEPYRLRSIKHNSIMQNLRAAAQCRRPLQLNERILDSPVRRSRARIGNAPIHFFLWGGTFSAGWAHS